MKIAVVGAAGRMGQMLVRRIAATEGMTLGGAANRPTATPSAAMPASSRAWKPAA